jgi:mannose-6-phosphate isomerase-like protein (cupin superfamily)
MHKVNIIKKLAQFDEYWQPRVVAELNGQYVKLAKFKGAFTWHKHDNEDEMFFVVKGKFRVEFRDKSVELCENEFIVVPKGIEHRSVADEEVEVMLFEPKTTLKTGSELS